MTMVRREIMKVVIFCPLKLILTEAGRHCFYGFAGFIPWPVN